jgi:hypothetical protein
MHQKKNATGLGNAQVANPTFFLSDNPQTDPIQYLSTAVSHKGRLNSYYPSIIFGAY